MRIFLPLLCMALLFTSCSTKNTGSYKKKSSTYSLRTKNPIITALYKEYKRWEGAPYKYGGTSKRGVDCSGFVQRVYFNTFRIQVPRTTKQQAKVGYKVSRDSLKAGDLLLFHTGYSVNHSGIYLERGNFIHASTKHGVTLSNINNPYWKSHYSQARRVISF